MVSWEIGNKPKETGEYWIVLPDKFGLDHPDLIIGWYYKPENIWFTECSITHRTLKNEDIKAFKSARIPDIPDEVLELFERR